MYFDISTECIVDNGGISKFYYINFYLLGLIKLWWQGGVYIHGLSLATIILIYAKLDSMQCWCHISFTVLTQYRHYDFSQIFSLLFYQGTKLPDFILFCYKRLLLHFWDFVYSIEFCKFGIHFLPKCRVGGNHVTRNKPLQTFLFFYEEMIFIVYI